MSNPSCEGLKRLAHDAAMQLYNASLAEAAQDDWPVPLEDLVHAASVHKARAEGKRAAPETLLSPAELQEEQDLVGGE